MLGSSLLMPCYLQFPDWLQQGFGFTSDLGSSIFIVKNKNKTHLNAAVGTKNLSLSKFTIKDGRKDYPRLKNKKKSC